jgi:hypothetical protein
MFIIGTSNNDTGHDSQLYDLTYFLKVTKVKVQNGTNIGTFHFLKVTKVKVQNGTNIGTFHYYCKITYFRVDFIRVGVMIAKK